MKRDKTFQGKDRERLRSVNPVTHFGFICLFILLYALSFARFNQEYKDLLPPGPFIQVRFVFFTAFVLVPFMFMSYLPLVIISTLGSYGSILFITMAIGADLSLLIPLSFPLLFALSLQLSYLQALFWIMVTNITIVLALGSHSAWGSPVIAGSVYQKLLFALFSLIMTILFIYLRRQSLIIKTLTASLERLDRAYQKVVDANLDFQTYALFAREEAMEKERRRLVGELHDIIGYSLTNLIMLIQAAQIGKGDSEQTHAILEKARLHADESLREIRHALAVLRSEPTDRPRGANLFLKLTTTFQEVTGITVAVDFANFPPSLPAKTEKIVYRLIQEGLTNAFRHGKATHVAISFWYDHHKISLRIRDNGTGGSTGVKQDMGQTGDRPGIGLTGLQEQVEQIGGFFTAGPISDGFILEAIVPMQET